MSKTQHRFSKNASGHGFWWLGQRSLGLGCLALVALLVGVLSPAFAQQGDWSWPWEEQRPKPAPREPVDRALPPDRDLGDRFRDRERSLPPDDRDARFRDRERDREGWNSTTRQTSVCQRLEQQLVQESQRGNQSRDVLPRLEAQIKDLERSFREKRGELERRDCYDYFLFSKTLRRSRQCLSLADEAEEVRRRLSDLEAERQDLATSASRNDRDEVLRELARNNCGDSYTRQARKRDDGALSSLWEGESSDGLGGANQYGALPFATYRTVCVRLCDGYYFPISFSTLPNHFERDTEKCQSQCAAPADLYYYQNPGGAVDQMVSAGSQELYTKLKGAFRYRKEFVPGCSCKQADYVPPEGTGTTANPERTDATPTKEPPAWGSPTETPEQRAEVPEGAQEQTPEPEIVPPPAEKKPRRKEENSSPPAFPF